MNKKFLGIKLSTLFTALICIVLSVVIWLLVKHHIAGQNAALAVIGCLAL